MLKPKNFNKFPFQMNQTGLLFFMLLVITVSVWAQNPDSTDSTAQREAQINEQRDALAELKLVNAAIDQCKKTVVNYKDRDFTPSTMLQLSHLYIKRGKLAYSLELEKFERMLALFDRGILKEEPEEPRIDYGPSLILCQDILKKFPEVDFRENLLYWYGLCLFEDNEREKASQIFKQLLSEFPGTEFADEVNFRIGEHYFDVQQYQSAIDVYKLTINKWNNPFFGMALYKLAWSHYKLNNYRESITTFFYLLRDLDMLDSLNCEEMGRSKLDLRDETIDYIAISFSEMGGLDVASDFLKEVSATEDQSIQITHSMGDIYNKRSFYDQALTIYQNLLKQYPRYEKAPMVQFGIFECYNKLDQYEKSIEARKDLVKNYQPNTPWGRVNTKSEIRATVKELINKVDFILASPILSKAEEAVARNDFQKAVQHYREFVENFPRDERAPRAAFNMAECHFEAGEYRDAAKVYLLVVKKFPPNELTEDAAYNRVICFDQLFLQEKDRQPDEITLTLGGKKTKFQVESTGQKELLQACQEFTQIIPSGDKTVEILLKSVEQYFKLEQLEVSQLALNRVMHEILKKKHGLKYYGQAASLMAQVLYKLENFKQAEKWYAVASRTVSDSLGDLRENSRKMMASARYKIAENLMAKGDSLAAAKEFERIALQHSGSEVAEMATYDAAMQFEKAGKYEKAVKMYDMFARRYNKSEHVEEALLRSGILYDKLGDHKKAATSYMQVYTRDPQSAAAPEALYSAGLAYETAEKWSLAAAAFGKYLQEYKAEPEKLVELAFKEANAIYKSKNYVLAQQKLISFLNYYQSLRGRGIEANDYLAAQASFYLAEIDYVYFSSVKLAPPLDVNMQKKQAVLNGLLQKYLETTNYKIADWTTAAFFKIGQAFENFGQSVMESTPPEGASEADLQQYWATIRVQLVHPLLGKALEYYQANEKLAAGTNIQNEWIDATRQRISVLRQELGEAVKTSAVSN